MAWSSEKKLEEVICSWIYPLLGDFELDILSLSLFSNLQNGATLSAFPCHVLIARTR